VRATYCLVLCCACTEIRGNLLSREEAPPKGDVVAWGAFAPKSVADLDAIAPYFDAGPKLAGFVIEPAGQVSLWSETPATFDESAAMAARLREAPFQAMTRHYLLGIILPGRIPDDSDGFAQVRANFRTIAAKAKAIGAKGVFLEVQTYAINVFSFPEIANGRPFSEVQQSLKRRGREVMNEMLAEFPDIEVVLGMGYAEVFRSVCMSGVPLEEDRYGLLPSFLDGLREALGSSRSAQLLDGFLASYAVKEAASFEYLAKARQFDAATLAAGPSVETKSFRFTPVKGVVDEFAWQAAPTLKCSSVVEAQLRQVLRQSYGIMLDYRSSPFDAQRFENNFHSDTGFRQVLDAARANADGLVWVFSDSVDWWARPTSAMVIPEAYRRALR
jgi:hypothetical protein